MAGVGFESWQSGASVMFLSHHIRLSPQRSLAKPDRTLKGQVLIHYFLYVPME